jgi:hypothetical protein
MLRDNRLMKEAYLAALLAGWYLMTPPPEANGRYDTAAPLSEWRVEAGFATGEECRKTLTLLASRARQEGRAGDLEKVKNARCASTSDPRLKEN